MPGAYSATVPLEGNVLVLLSLWAWRYTRKSGQCPDLIDGRLLTRIRYTRNPKDTSEARKDDSYCVPGTGDPDGLIPAKWFHGSSTDDINNFLKQDLDILVMSLPLTTETHGVISYEQFEILSKKKT